jgi:hypothetical protein
VFHPRRSPRKDFFSIPFAASMPTAQSNDSILLRKLLYAVCIGVFILLQICFLVVVLEHRLREAQGMRTAASNRDLVPHQHVFAAENIFNPKLVDIPCVTSVEKKDTVVVLSIDGGGTLSARLCYESDLPPRT